MVDSAISNGQKEINKALSGGHGEANQYF